MTLLKHGLLIMNNDRRQIEIRTPTASGRRVRTLKSVQLVPNVHAPRFQLVHRSQNLRIKQTHLVGNKRSSGKEGLNQWRFNFHINTYRTNRQYPRPQALIDGVCPSDWVGLNNKSSTCFAIQRSVTPFGFLKPPVHRSLPTETDQTQFRHLPC